MGARVDWKRRYHDMIGRCVDEGLRAMFQWAPGMDRFCLWYREVTYVGTTPDEWGDLRMAQECPGEGWQLARPEFVPMSKTRDGLFQWVQSVSDRLPVIGKEDAVEVSK